MERYDPALSIIAAAQQARDAGDHGCAHAHFVRGVEELLRLVQDEADEGTKTLVRKHVARFMDEAEQLVAVPSQRAKLLQAKAQGVEARAQKAHKDLKFTQALSLYTEAANEFKLLRQEALGKQRDWAGERALAMIEKAEHLQNITRRMGGARSSNGSAHGVGGGDSEFDSLLVLPHAVGAPGYEEEEALPDNFARPEEADTGHLPISLTWLLARSKKRSEEEEQVLIMGNRIHGRRFDRIYAVDVAPDNFAGEPYKDDQGQLRFSREQKSQGVAWGRPAQIFGLYPVVIKEISHVGITQQHGPCTFVSSLAVCAAWERRFGRTLISRNIFPQRNGVPVLSPSGKYIVKMYLNGSVRKITIDDYLPVMQVGAPRGVPCPHPPGCRAPCPRSRQAGPGRCPLAARALTAGGGWCRKAPRRCCAASRPRTTSCGSRSLRRPTSSCTPATTFRAPPPPSTSTPSAAGSPSTFLSLLICLLPRLPPLLTHPLLHLLMAPPLRRLSRHPDRHPHRLARRRRRRLLLLGRPRTKILPV